MFAVHVTREMRPIGVLLGGSGRARILTQHAPMLPALLRPCQRAVENSDLAPRTCRAPV